jgi:hypothetical protein
MKRRSNFAISTDILRMKVKVFHTDSKAAGNRRACRQSGNFTGQPAAMSPHETELMNPLLIRKEFNLTVLRHIMSLVMVYANGFMSLS